jgi:hypothetical protein
MLPSLGARDGSVLPVSPRWNPSVSVGSGSHASRIKAKAFVSSLTIAFDNLSHLTAYVKPQELSESCHRQISLIT